MRITLTITSGARNGVSKSFDQAYVGIGRHPQSDLQLHPDQDLDASTRHAAVLKSGETWAIRDLGSANGTFVNGEKVTADRRLHTGDQVRLGNKGPVIGVEVAGEAAPAAQATRMSGGSAAGGGGNTSARIRVEVEKQTKSLRRATLVLFGLLIVVAGGYFWQKASYEKRIAGLQGEMLATIDSIRNASDTITVRFAAMQGVVDSAKRATAAIGARIQSGGDEATLQRLRRQLDSAISHQRGLQAAAGLDGAHVDSLAGDAVALVIVKFPGDHKFSGTAWAIRSDAEGAYLVTNRHVVTSHEGEDPVEIGVMFNHSRQFFRATLVRKHPNADVDLALLRVQVHGGVPVIPGVASDPAVVGEAVVSIGFPLGLDLEGSDLVRQGANATLTAGTVSRLTNNLVQLDGYGATGASGSPILDQHGHVVAVLYGGQQESGGRIVYAVPASFIAELFNGQ